MFEWTESLLSTQDKGELRRQRNYCTVLGVLFAIAGLCCLVYPMVSTFLVALVVGWLFLLSGVTLIVTTLSFHKVTRLINLVVGILLGVAYLFLGYEFIRYPAVAALSLAFLIGALFLFSGVSRLIAYFAIENRKGLGVTLALGILEIALAVILISSGSASSILLVSFIVAFQFLGSAVALFSMSSLIKKML